MQTSGFIVLLRCGKLSKSGRDGRRDPRHHTLEAEGMIEPRAKFPYREVYRKVLINLNNLLVGNWSASMVKPVRFRRPHASAYFDTRQSKRWRRQDDDGNQFGNGSGRDR